MDVWTLNKWQEYYKSRSIKSGIKVDFDKTVDPEIKRAVKEFVAWLRSQYEFPKQIRMYIKAASRVKAKDGEMVFSTFFWPYDRDDAPYCRIATGGFEDAVVKYGKDNVLAAILTDIARDLTHYFQWLNDVKLTPIGEARQATNYAKKILQRYAETHKHP